MALFLVSLLQTGCCHNNTRFHPSFFRDSNTDFESKFKLSKERVLSFLLTPGNLQFTSRVFFWKLEFSVVYKQCVPVGVPSYYRTLELNAEAADPKHSMVLLLGGWRGAAGPGRPLPVLAMRRVVPCGAGVDTLDMQADLARKSEFTLT